MLHRFGLLRPLSGLFPLLILLSFPTGTMAEVVLSEVLADPVSDWSGDGEIYYKDDEWVEIVNRGDTALDLSAFWLSDSSTDPACRYRFSGELLPGAFRYVTGEEAVAWQAEMGMGSAGLSLANTGGEVVLYVDVSEDSVEIVDLVSYLSYQVDDDRTLGRYPMDGDEWVMFDGLNLYHGNQEPGSTGCLPSPGEINTCGQSPVEKTAWSQIKSLFAPK